MSTTAVSPSLFRPGRRAILGTIVLLFVALLLPMSGCVTSREAATEWKPFKGEMVWLPQGRRDGTWGIKASGFGRINPMNEIPEAVQKDGLKVEGEILLRGDAGSIRQWGTSAEVRNLRPRE
jgi:hypothetical protein